MQSGTPQTVGRIWVGKAPHLAVFNALGLHGEPHGLDLLRVFHHLSVLLFLSRFTPTPDLFLSLLSLGTREEVRKHLGLRHQVLPLAAGGILFFFFFFWEGNDGLGMADTKARKNNAERRTDALLCFVRSARWVGSRFGVRSGAHPETKGSHGQVGLRVTRALKRDRPPRSSRVSAVP